MKTLGDTYKAWHRALQDIPKLSRFTLGIRIDTLFIETIEYILLAAYAPKGQKGSILKRASTKLDALKFFLQLAWEMKLITNPTYLALAGPLTTSGKMLGGWQKQFDPQDKQTI